MSKEIKTILVVGKMSEIDRVGNLLAYDRNVGAACAWNIERVRFMLASSDFLKGIELVVMSYDLDDVEAIGMDLTKEFRAAGFTKPILANLVDPAHDDRHASKNKLLVEAGCTDVGWDLRLGVVRLLGLL